jgi:hypothetical protein
MYTSQAGERTRFNRAHMTRQAQEIHMIEIRKGV